MQRSDGKKKTAQFFEKDMYPFLRDYLIGLGYTVTGEVGSCDIVARDGESLIAVEMKRGLGMKLLLQGVERQDCFDAVYLALPAEGSSISPNLKRYLKLIKRLELGLLLVRRLSHRTRVELLFHPMQVQRRKNHRGRKAILRELSGRSGDFTPGGSRGKVVTAYREEALYLALLLENRDTLSPAMCRALGASGRAGAILRDNHYGWFNRVGRGLYRLDPAGRKALEEYPELTALLRGQLDTSET